MRTLSPTFFAISPALWLVCHPIPAVAPTVVTPRPVNHFIAIDCSGSMSGQLGEVGDQLKNELPSLVGPDDTVSLFWFSGTGECGPIVEGATMRGPVELEKLRRAIDATLRPVGLTCFNEPLGLLKASIAKVTAARHGLVSLFFMSDGQHNQGGTRADVLKAVEGLAGLVDSFTAVEVGWYADRALLSAMAQKVGGQVVACSDLRSYKATLARHVQARPASEPRVRLGLKARPVEDVAFALTPGGDLLTFDTAAGTVEVPPAVGTLFYVTEDKPSEKSGNLAAEARLTENARGTDAVHFRGAYAALAVFAHSMNADVVYALLRALGDVAFVRQFSSCYGIQPYLAFEQAVLAAALDPSKRWAIGFDPAAVPNDDALTVLDVLRILVDGNAGLLTEHPAWSYSKISRGRDEATALTAEHRKLITEALAGAKGVLDLDAVRDKIAEIQAGTVASLTFTPDPAPAGHSMSGLVPSSKRANASIQVTIPGTVDLTAIMTEELASFGVPTILPTKIVRNYAVISGGIIHTTQLPVQVDVATWAALVKAGVPGVDRAAGYQPVVVIDLTGMATINRRMVTRVSAERLFGLEWERLQRNADAAVCEHFLTTWFGGVGAAKAKGLAACFGDVAATVLAGYGIKDYGFSPTGQKAKPSVDFYEAKSLDLGFAGFKSAPKVSDVLARLSNEAKGLTGKGKGLTPVMELYRPMIEEVRQFCADRGLTLDIEPAKLSPLHHGEIKTWLGLRRDTAEKRSRAISFELAELSYAILVGQAWPFKTRAESTFTLDVGGKIGPVQGTVETGTEKVLI